MRGSWGVNFVVTDVKIWLSGAESCAPAHLVVSSREARGKMPFNGEDTGAGTGDPDTPRARLAMAAVRRSKVFILKVYGN